MSNNREKLSMLTYPFSQPYPIALQLGPLKIHWYGITYLVGFALAWFLGIKRAQQSGGLWTRAMVGDLIFYTMLGVIVGGRLGYMLFYDFADLIASPLMLFKIWQGGMAFHGGLLGVMLAMYLFAKREKKTFFEVADFTTPLVPLGLAAGRLGNFINGELCGHVTTLPWGVIFPHVDWQPRHPSQLYEFLFEGILLFTIIWFYSAKPKPRMAVSGLFLLGYGVFRFVMEFFRVPDAQIGYIAFDWMTKGQLLCLPMMGFGLLLISLSYRRQPKERKYV